MAKLGVLCVLVWDAVCRETFMPWAARSSRSGCRRQLLLLFSLLFACGIIGNLTVPQIGAENVISIVAFLIGVVVVVSVYRRM